MNYNIKFSFDNTLKNDIESLLKYLDESGFYQSSKKNKERMDDISYNDIGNTGIILKTIPYRLESSQKKKIKVKTNN